MTPYPAIQFALVRAVLGIYVAVHFAELLPWAAEMFSSAGVFPARAQLPWLGSTITPAIATASMAGLAILGLMLAAGVFRRGTALLLWCGWAFSFELNPFIANPSYPYIGWLLLAFALVPSGEPWCLGGRKRHGDWFLPAPLLWGAWMILAVGYCAAGVHKLACPSWMDGSALRHIVTMPPFARTIWSPNPSLSQVASWSVLALEVGFPLLCLTAAGRAAAWLTATAMHVGILVLLDATDLTLGMLVFHLFTYDRRWLSGRP